MQRRDLMVEAVLPSFYLPGLRPQRRADVPARRHRRVHAARLSEPEVGLSDRFDEIMRPRRRAAAPSPPVADSGGSTPGLPLLLGMDRDRRRDRRAGGGMLAFLPGIPPRRVTDRQGYVQARIDYLNHLFSSNAYLVARRRQSARSRSSSC